MIICNSVKELAGNAFVSIGKTVKRNMGVLSGNKKIKDTQMKPIILVIVGGAILLLAMHQDTDKKDELSQSSKEHKLHIKVQEKKQDTETLTHNVSLEMDRLQ